MSIFKRRLNNTAAAIPAPAGQARPIVPPGNTTVHHHAPNRLWEIAGWTGAAILFLIFLWWALVELFRQMGAVNPGNAAAGLVIYGGLITGGLWFLSFLFDSYFERYLGFRVEIAKEMTERERVRLLAAQTSIDPGRYNESDFQFARVILACMMIAYKWIEEHNGAAFRGQWRPWSMRSAKETAAGIGIKLTDAQANGVSLWLHEHGVIDSPAGGQVTKTYPDLSNVRLLLDKEYGKPIQVVSPALRDNRGFEHI